MDKNTLSQYGWVVIALIILIILITLATPFGNYIKDAVSASTEAMSNKVKTTFTNAGINVENFPNSMSDGITNSNTSKALSVKPGNNTLAISTKETVNGLYTGIIVGFDFGDPEEWNTSIPADDETYYTDRFDVKDGYSLRVTESSLMSGYYGTGTTLEVLDSSDNVVEKYVAIIFGDINGDTYIDGCDVTIINGAITGVDTLNDIQKIAADADGNKIINDNDRYLIDYWGACMLQVDQNTPSNCYR